MQVGKARFPHRSCTRQDGFTYIWMLAAIAILSVGLSGIGPIWSDQVRRERERDLLHVGSMYAGAIAAYYKASPGSEKQYPRTLQELIEDTRMVGTVRYMRKLYPDPLEPNRPWGLVLDLSGHVRGVYSQSNASPLRLEPIELETTTLLPAQQYSGWKFIAKVSS